MIGRGTLRRGIVIAMMLTAFIVVLGHLYARAAETAVSAPAPAFDPQATGGGLQTMVIAGGCFWGVQGVFQHVKGVQQAVSGYAGGAKADPSYEDVSTGTVSYTHLTLPTIY